MIGELRTGHKCDQWGAHFCKEGIAFASLVLHIELLFTIYFTKITRLEIIIPIEQMREQRPRGLN